MNQPPGDSTRARRSEHGSALLHRLWPVFLGLLTAIVIAAWMAWSAAQQLDALNDLADQRAAARRSRFAVENVLSLMKDVETGQRGFVITGDERFLEPHASATALLPQARLQVRSELQGRPERLTAWDAIEDRIERRLSASAEAIETRRSIGAAIIRQESIFERGKQEMDALRRRSAELATELNADLDRINAKMLRQRQVARENELLAALAAGLLLLLSMGLILRDRWLRLRAEAASDAARSELEDRVRERTAALSDASERIASFAIEQERSVEAERRRIAREVHDQLGQVFTAIRLVLGGLPRTSLPAAEAAALDQALEQGISTSRRIAADLRPPLLDDLGLEQALKHHGERLAPRGRPEFRVECRDEDRLNDEQRLSLFRIAQEACTNALRHSQAGQVRISGWAQGERYLFEISDDGLGLRASAPRAGSQGLSGMSERARLGGGDLAIHSTPGGGTLVQVWLPLQTRREG